MKDEEILDPFKEFDLAAFDYVLLPLVNDKLEPLDTWRQAWSKHRTRTIKTSLFISGYLVR